ncbi:MAG: 4Fe-4S binding protein [Halanaerobiaceae bacterium]
MSPKRKPGWKEIPRGGVITEAGNAARYKTGGWRIKKPLWSEDKCIQCMLCWIYCPDLAFFVENKEVTGIDYDHCKGCGICANQCPANALEMIAEDEADQRDKGGQDDIEKEDEK